MRRDTRASEPCLHRSLTRRDPTGDLDGRSKASLENRKLSGELLRSASNAFASFKLAVSKPSVKPVVELRKHRTGFIAAALLRQQSRKAKVACSSPAINLRWQSKRRSKRSARIPLELPIVYRSRRRAGLHRFREKIFSRINSTAYSSSRAFTARAIRDAGSYTINCQIESYVVFELFLDASLWSAGGRESPLSPARALPSPVGRASQFVRASRSL
jgi:hypothetical protein